jgi:ATP-dependent RNA circularization protein (DNA/RNA ligase family)
MELFYSQEGEGKMIKYQHIERIGNDEVDGLLVGKVCVQPKIDGANGQIGLDESGALYCASRNQVLSEAVTNQGFWNHVQENAALYLAYLREHPTHILYGEWLVPHSLKTYRASAWRKFYVFDVWDTATEKYLPFENYAPALEACGVEVVPVLVIIHNPTEEKLLQYVQANTYLIEDGNGPGEGIVLKNYAFANRYGRTTWAKIVRNEFKEENRRAFGVPEVTMSSTEARITEQYVTAGRLEKVKAKMQEAGPWSSRRVPEYLNRVWHELITEEMWNILKAHKNPAIDFKLLNRMVITRIKELDPATF